MKFSLKRPGSFHAGTKPEKAAAAVMAGAGASEPDAVLRAILVLLKDFALDIGELDAQGFRDDVDAMAREMLGGPLPRNGFRGVFDRFKRRLMGFIARQKDYVVVREKELREIIDLLSQALATFDSDNRIYHQTVYEQSDTIEGLTRLDDIRKIKQSLRQEVSLMQRTITEKQERDQERVAGLSLQIQNLNAELEKSRAESLSDGLTAAYNRRAFDWEIRSLIDRSTVMHRPFSLMLLDIDDFKKINDIHGHPVGDRVLVSMVDKCREYIRAEDFFARYGGEEFALILPGASLRNAVKKARHIGRAVAGTRYLTDDTPSGKPLRVTISIGVSAFAAGDTVESLVARADKALYRAKQEGKNRVVSR